MAGRMPQTSVKLDPQTAAVLVELQARLRREQGVKASREDIVGALAYGTPPAQLVWMLPAFIKYSEGMTPIEGEGEVE
jgi:hypothetical protein